MCRAFQAASILLPNLADYSTWAVIACDQYTSQPEYWKRVEKQTAGKPSTLNLILPEAWLDSPKGEQHQKQIRQNMLQYLQDGLFVEHPSCFVYVERTLSSGQIRTGLVGMVDLEEYDFRSPSTSAIRATEATIESRIPPRAAIRKEAPLELPHVLMLADDPQDFLMAPLRQNKEALPVLYDFDLMENGGHICGRLVDGSAALAFNERLDQYAAAIETKYPEFEKNTLLFAVGDGNHSLATAKAIWEQTKKTLSPKEQENHPARFALAELENIHEASLQFEPIHRLLSDVDESLLLTELQEVCAPSGFPLTWFADGRHQTVYLDPQKGELACAILQKFLDRYLEEHEGSIDYIHGDKDLEELSSRQNHVGFILPAIDKSSLFKGVIADGSLPRKTFSMGHAQEKRYYLESKKIQLV